MYMENKKDYAAPMIILFEVRPQQVLCLSAPDFGDGGDIPYND